MALKRDIEILQRVPLFSLVEAEALQLIAFAAEGRSFRAGDVLFRRGDPSDGGYLITGGSVALETGEQGQGATLVQPGALVGELAMIIETERPVTAVAQEPTTALRLTREMFRRVMQEFPDSASAMRDAIAEQAQATAAGLTRVRYRLASIDRLDEQRSKGRT